MTDKNFNVIREQIKAFREKHGPVSSILLEESKEQIKIQRIILAALDNGPKTVPELFQATGLDARKVLWYVTALRKYGKIGDGPKRGDYPSYIPLKEKL
jgi:hypothetical protein